MKHFIAFIYSAMSLLFLATCSYNPVSQRQISDEELLEFVYHNHKLPDTEPISLETYKSSVQLQRAAWDVNQDGQEEIVFSVDFSMPDMVYILVVSPQNDSMHELFFSEKFGWYDLNGRFIFQDGYLFLNYLSKGGGSNIRASDWEQEVVRCSADACSSFSYVKYAWMFSFGVYGEEPITETSVAQTFFNEDTVTVREYLYRDGKYHTTNTCYNQAGKESIVSAMKNLKTLGPVKTTQYHWDGSEFTLVFEKEETPAISFERFGQEKPVSMFRQTLYALHDRWENGEVSEEKIEQDYLHFFDISPASYSPCSLDSPKSIASAYADDFGAEVVRAKEGCRLKVWQSPDWEKIQNLKEIKAIGTFDFTCDADFTRLLWLDINADDVKELFVLTQNGFDETVYIFRAENTLQQIGTFSGFMREPNFRGIEWEWREGKFFLLVGKPFWKDQACRNNLDCYEAIDYPFDAYFWDETARLFAPTCDITLPADEFAACQNIQEQALSAALTLVAQTATSAALSATPTPTASATPTMTPTRTPVPTSTVWRVEPVSTPVAKTYKPLDYFGVEDLPSFGMGKRWETHPPIDYDGDGKADFFDQLYTKLTSEESNEFHQALMTFWDTHGIAPEIDASQFAVLDALDIDLDRDGKRETAFAYVLGESPSAVFGVAVMRDGQILDSTPLDWQGEYVREMRLIGVPISSRQIALLAHLTTVVGGSGIYPRIYRRLLTFEENKLRIVWDWEYFGGGRGGAGFQHYQNEKIRFVNLTGQPEANLLLSRASEQISLSADNPANYLNYALQLPGELVFSWADGEYLLTHFYDDGSLVPIRPLHFITHAPKMDTPLTLDGDKNDWYQVEYRDTLQGFGEETGYRSAGLRSFRMAWDETSLYYSIYADPNSTVWLALDMDLQGDFDSRALDDDDRLFRFQLKDGIKCMLTESAFIHPSYKPLAVQNMPPTFPYGECVIEGNIPFSDLGNPPSLSPSSGFILRTQPFKKDYIATNFLFSQYFPIAEKIIGFALFAENKNSAILLNPEKLLPFDPQDPTTWGTLIFISDR